MILHSLCLVSLLGAVASGVPGSAAARDARTAQGSGPKALPERVSSGYADLELASPETRKGGELVLRLTISPHEGIYIYAPGQRGYYPIALTFPGRDGITAGKLDLPPAEPYVFEPTGERFMVYRRTFTAVQHATLAPGGAAAQSGRISATLQYQACDERVCFKPEKVSLSWTLGEAGKGRSERNP